MSQKQLEAEGFLDLFDAGFFLIDQTYYDGGGPGSVLP